jgi:hypothetical protein
MSDGETGKEDVSPEVDESDEKSESGDNDDEEDEDHDVPDRGMNAECTHVCVYRLDNGEVGEKSFCQKSSDICR